MTDTIRQLLGLIRFSHTLFALPFALLSAALAWHAEGVFRWLDLLGIVVCLVFARAAAMAFNRLTDRHYDAANPRTAGRHLPAGSLSVATVVSFTLLTSAGFVLGSLVFLYREPSNPWPLYLAAPVLLFLLGYSLTKRFTSLAHFWLGMSLMLAPVAAWIAVRGMVEMTVPLILGGAVLFWVSGFDILYACQDVDFDKKAGLHSVPSRFGIVRSLRIAAGCHAVAFGLLMTLGFASPPLSWVYAVGLTAVGVLLVVEHRLVSPTDLTRVNAAFFQVNAVISIGMLVTVLVQLAVGW